MLRPLGRREALEPTGADDLPVEEIIGRVVGDLVARYIGLVVLAVALLLVATLLPSRVLEEGRASAGAKPSATSPASAPEQDADAPSCESIPGPVPTAPAGVAATLLGLASPLLTALGPFTAGVIPLLGVISPLLDIIGPIAGLLQPFLDRVYPWLVNASQVATTLWAGPLATLVPRLTEINDRTVIPFVRNLLEVSGPIVEAISASDVVPCLQIVVTRLAGGPVALPQPGP